MIELRGCHESINFVLSPDLASLLHTVTPDLSSLLSSFSSALLVRATLGSSELTPARFKLLLDVQAGRIDAQNLARLLRNLDRAVLNYS